ncbi:MAG: asparagine synthase (glutamine-hydrolyzing) [Stackebrandtia sp.]
MCGIAGWVGYDSDVTAERGLLDAMTETMSCRGPDASGVWLDSHVGLGHRRLAVIDIEGGKQPMMVVEDGRTVLVTTYSGEIYNYRELRRELETHGHRFRTTSDTEVALRAYLQWGDDFATRLNGMYAFALWDPRDEELLLVRDRMGVKPLYYYPTADGVIFGSEPKAILAHPAAEAAVDGEGLAEMMTMVKTPGRAIYRGMRELRPGHTLRVSRRGIRERRYWALQSHEHTDDLDTTIGNIRELLDDIVERQLISDVPLCTLLSGGLDSSIITALAQKQLSAAGNGPVRSFAVDFVGHTENFRPDPARSTPDGPYAHALAEHVGSDHNDIVLNTAQLTDPGNRNRVLIARDLPIGLAEGDTSLYLLFKAVREQSTVALSGESADEVFGGYSWFHDEVALSAGTFPWLASARRFSGTAQNLSFFNRDVVAKVDLAGYARRSYQEALDAVPRLDGETGKERRMREVSHMHLTRFVQVLLDRKDRASMACGLEVRVPFCDHRLVQYVFNTPWAMKNFDGREKSLLRAATRDVLPDLVADRVKSPYPSTQDPAYDEVVRADLKRLLADSDAPVHPLLDAPFFSESMDSLSGPAARHVGERALEINDWLRRYRVSVTL